MAKVEQFEQEVKKRFIEQPGQMKLLIVVDKLLTGFDASPATYLWASAAVAEAVGFALRRLQEGDEAARRTAERYLVDASELRWTPDQPPGSDHLVASAPPTPTT